MRRRWAPVALLLALLAVLSPLLAAPLLAAAACDDEAASEPCAEDCCFCPCCVRRQPPELARSEVAVAPEPSSPWPQLDLPMPTIPRSRDILHVPKRG